MKKHNLIVPLLIVSCAIHGLFLFSYTYDPAMPVIEAGDMQIAVTLDTSAQNKVSKHLPPSKQHAVQKKQSDMPSKAEPVAHVVQNPNTLHEQETAAEESSATRKSTSTPISEQSSIYRAYVKSRVKNQLKQYFYYPKIASRHGWQGHVLLGFNVSATGKIYNITIAKSSGYDVLDNAALDSLNQVKYIHHKTQHQAMDIDVKLPVIYRIIGGYRG